MCESAFVLSERFTKQLIDQAGDQHTQALLQAHSALNINNNQRASPVHYKSVVCDLAQQASIHCSAICAAKCLTCD